MRAHQGTTMATMGWVKKGRRLGVALVLVSGGALLGLGTERAAAQNRFGDTPTAPPAGSAGGGRPAGQGGPGAPGGQAAQGGAGLGALAGPGGIAGPQGGQGGSAAQGGRAPAQGTPQGSGSGVDLARLEAHERQDHGVPATPHLHRGPMHGGTPTSIPGGQVVTTRGLIELVRVSSAAQPSGGQAGGGAPQVPRVLFFDVLGGAERLPGALAAVPAHQAGSFDDAVQREFGTFLQQVTQGRPDAALVFYCASTQCWMSYNAALRAIRLGHKQVLWYRGGVEAWKAAGLPVQTAGGPSAQGGAPRQGGGTGPLR